MSTVDIVFAPVVDGDDDLGDIVSDEGLDALVRAGYRAEDDPREPALPARSNLPSGGALEALLATWRQVTG